MFPGSPSWLPEVTSEARWALYSENRFVQREFSAPVCVLNEDVGFQSLLSIVFGRKECSLPEDGPASKRVLAIGALAPSAIPDSFQHL